jgi:hypothetical protein
MDPEALAMQQLNTWSRTIQANLARFYLRVITPVVQAAPVHGEITTGTAPDMETFLDRAKAQVDNYTANEANKVYALVLIALFERYLRLWAAQELSGTGIKVEREDIAKLLTAVADKFGIDLGGQDMGKTLLEAHLIGNVVRHGEGGSMNRIRETAPHLIDRSKRQYVDLIAQNTPDSEWLRIWPSDLDRYFGAMIRFWGLVDRQPNAVTSMLVGG